MTDLEPEGEFETYEYPTEAALERIAAWSYTDSTGWFAFVRSIWWAADWGWREYDGRDDFGKPVRVYTVSTGGWSGNESIIAAMRRSHCWTFTWCEHRRGGHYVFEIRR